MAELAGRAGLVDAGEADETVAAEAVVETDETLEVETDGEDEGAAGAGERTALSQGELRGAFAVLFFFGRGSAVFTSALSGLSAFTSDFWSDLGSALESFFCLRALDREAPLAGVSAGRGTVIEMDEQRRTFYQM